MLIQTRHTRIWASEKGNDKNAGAASVFSFEAVDVVTCNSLELYQILNLPSSCNMAQDLFRIGPVNAAQKKDKRWQKDILAVFGTFRWGGGSGVFSGFILTSTCSLCNTRILLKYLPLAFSSIFQTLLLLRSWCYTLNFLHVNQNNTIMNTQGE